MWEWNLYFKQILNKVRRNKFEANIQYPPPSPKAAIIYILHLHKELLKEA